MDYLQFTAAIVDSIAWPAAIIILVILLRKALLRLLRRLRLFRFKDLEVEFSEKLAEAEQEASKLNVVVDRSMPDALQADRYLKLAQISPSAAILEAWLEVENALLDLAREKTPNFPKIKTLTSKIKLLRHNEILDQETAALINDLRALRNIAVHADSSVNLTSTDAERYRLMAIRAAAALKKQIEK